MNRRIFGRLMTASLSLALLLSSPFARAADEAPDALIKRVSSEVLDAIKADKSVQAGEMSKVITLVDSKVMPNVNFVRMTASAVGRNWRQATPEQQKEAPGRIQDAADPHLFRRAVGGQGPDPQRQAPARGAC